MNFKKYLIAGLLTAISLTGLLIGSSSVSAASSVVIQNDAQVQLNSTADVYDVLDAWYPFYRQDNDPYLAPQGFNYYSTINGANFEDGSMSFEDGKVFKYFTGRGSGPYDFGYDTNGQTDFLIGSFDSQFMIYINGTLKFTGSSGMFYDIQLINITEPTNVLIKTESKNYVFSGVTYLHTGTQIGKIGSLTGDSKTPVISGVNYSVVSNIENPFTFSEIISGIKAIDNTDGDITDQITYTTNYPRNNDFSSLKLGNYTVQASVSDKAGNVSTFDFTIYVIDVNSPTFTGTTTYSQSYTSKISLDTIKSKITVNDSYEGNIPSSSWTLVSDSYSENYHKVGYYEVKYKAADKSGNEVLIVIGVNVIDDVAPSITGANTITKNQDVVLTASTILQNYTANDAVDGVITSSIKIKTDNYTGKGATVGTYTLILTVSDKAGNSTDFTIEIIVVDNIPPVYYLDQDTIIVSSSSALTKTQMINILRQMGKIDPAALNYVTLTSKYFETPTTADNYLMKVSVNSSSGMELEEEFNIRVTEVKTDELKVDPAFEIKDFIKEEKVLIITILLASGIIATIVLSTKNGRKRSKKRYKR